MSADIIALADRRPRKIKVTNYFGGCPECGSSSGYRNISRVHWDCCETHKVKWCIGSNLFSDWRSETEADWKTNAEALAQYREVQPLPCSDMPS